MILAMYVIEIGSNLAISASIMFLLYLLVRVWIEKNKEDSGL